MQFEIQDDKQVLFRGSPIEVMRIWEALTVYKRGQRAEFEAQKHLIPFKKWQGNIRIVSIIHEMDCVSTVHTIEGV